MVDLEKYKNNGWGLSKKCFQDIQNIVEKFKSKEINVVEFGSGISTVFLVDLINEGHDLKIVSFDNSVEYATKITHPNLKTYITELVDCYDGDFETQFQKGKYEEKFFQKKITPVHTRQKNTFYSIEEGQLSDRIDIMIVDGPHGNGRNIAFLHGVNRLGSGSYVVIDDYNHYDFVERFQMLFRDTELIAESNTGGINQWELGGIYKIFKII